MLSPKSAKESKQAALNLLNDGAKGCEVIASSISKHFADPLVDAFSIGKDRKLSIGKDRKLSIHRIGFDTDENEPSKIW